MRTIMILIGLLLILLSSSCAIVTTYGKEPEKLGSNSYQFKLYYNIYSSDAEIDNKAEDIVKDIKTKNNHQQCKYSRVDTRPYSGSQSVVYNVTCS